MGSKPKLPENNASGPQQLFPTSLPSGIFALVTFGVAQLPPKSTKQRRLPRGSEKNEFRNAVKNKFEATPFFVVVGLTTFSEDVFGVLRSEPKIYLVPGIYTTVCTTLTFFPEYFYVPTPVAGLSSRYRLRFTQGARVYTTARVWIPASLRGACSGCSKYRNLANNCGETFRPPTAKQDSGNLTIEYFALLPAAAAAAAAVSCLMALRLKLSDMW